MFWVYGFIPRPKHNKKKWRFYFLFILVRTTTKSIQFINKPVFLFSFFRVVVLLLLANSNNYKNRHFIYDLSMLWLCLGLYHHCPNPGKDHFNLSKHCSITLLRLINKLSRESFPKVRTVLFQLVASLPVEHVKSKKSRREPEYMNRKSVWLSLVKI
jgi:hypothetical protein